MKGEWCSSIKATCEYESGRGNSERFIAIFPEKLVWSEFGMGQIFKAALKFIADPEKYPEDDTIQEARDSFHIISISENEGFVLDSFDDEPVQN